MILASLIIAPLLAALASILLRQQHARILEGVTALAAVVEVILAALLIPLVVTQKNVSIGFLSVDALGTLLALIIAAVSSLAGFYSIGYLRAEVAKGIIGFSRVRQFFVLFNLFVFAMFLAVSADNPIVMWIGIEGTTLATAFLISFYNKPSSMEAAWKYLVVNSLGLLLGLLGTLLFLAQSTQGITWESLKAGAGAFDPLLVKLAFVFVLVGYGTKVGLVPMHTWLPDAHSKAPSPVSAMLSGVLLNVALFAVLKFKMVADIALSDNFTAELLIIFGTISVVVSGLIIFVQRNYKRLLAYSSIEHMGLMAAGFGFGGIGIAASLLHMIYHAFTKSLLFMVAGVVFLKYSSTKIRNISGMIRTLPVSAVLFFAAVLAATGMPPFGLFSTKLWILTGAAMEYPYIALIIFAGLIIAFIGFLKDTTAMVFGNPPEGMDNIEPNGFTLSVPLVLITLVLVLSFWIPEPLKALIESAALSLAPL